MTDKNSPSHSSQSSKPDADKPLADTARQPAAPAQGSPASDSKAPATGASASAADGKTNTPVPPVPPVSSAAAAASDKPAPAAKSSSSLSSNLPPSAPAATSAASQPPAARRSGSGWQLAFVLALVVALVLGAGLWYQHQQFQTVRAQLSDQLAQGNAAARQAQEQAQRVQDALQQQASRLNELQTGQERADAQLQGLEEALQDATDSSSDAMLLNDIDRLVVMAQQQLQLSGNVGNAIVALESAQSQLARANRSGLSSLQQSINGDIDRLRAVASVDVAVLTTRLDELYTLVGQAPLQMPESTELGQLAQPAATAPDAAAAQPAPADSQPDAEASWWRQALDQAQVWSVQAWTSVSQDIHRLIEVRRVDDASVLLMSPDQASRLRDNLRLRVMTARLALLMRQPDVWQSELKAVQDALDSRFDTRQAPVRRAQTLVQTLRDTPIAIALPTLDNSVHAIQAQRDALARQDASASDRPAVRSSSSADDTASDANAAQDQTPAPDLGPLTGEDVNGSNDANEGNSANGTTNGNGSDAAAGGAAGQTSAVPAMRS